MKTRILNSKCLFGLLVAAMMVVTVGCGRTAESPDDADVSYDYAMGYDPVAARDAALRNSPVVGAAAVMVLQGGNGE